MVHEDPDLYAYLATSKVREVTVAQLEQSLENSFINKSNIEFWKGAITVSRLLEVSRTYSHGIVIPEKSAIVTDSIGPGEFFLIQPSGTSVWEITAISVSAASGTPVVAINMFDGSTPVLMHSGTSSTTASSFFPWESSLPVTPTGYLMIQNTDLSDTVSVNVAYHVVSL